MPAPFNLPSAFLLASLFLHASLAAEIVCEDLSKDACAFAISSSGQRCLLETYAAMDGGGAEEMLCRTSEIMVERMAGHVESNDCVDACGVDRSSAGAYLPDICTVSRSNLHRSVIQLMMSSSFAAVDPTAPGPV
ncbi:hypothetical protein LINPERPRIM_LOCUS26026 [Linum perenne]